MTSELYAFVSLLFGCVGTWLWVTARQRWQRGRGLVQRPAVVAAENEKRLQEAAQNRAQGCREMVRALLELVALVVLTFVLGLILSSVNR